MKTRRLNAYTRREAIGVREGVKSMVGLRRVAMLVTVAAFVASCGGGGTDTAPQAETTESEGAESVLSQVNERGVLRVAGPQSEPFIIRDPGGSWDGLDVELLRILASQMNVELEFIPTAFDTVVAGVQGGQ